MRSSTEIGNCRHERRTLLGVDGMAFFYRCDDCRELLITQGGRLWRLPPSPA